MLSEFWAQKGWTAFIALAIAGVAFYAWIGIGAQARAMERHGIETEATVVELTRTVHPVATDVGAGTVPRVSVNYAATVMFTTGAALDGSLKIQQAKHFVDRAYYDSTSEGDRVWVRYLPDDPTKIELVRGGTQSNSNAAGWVSLGMAAIAAFLGWLIWTHAARIHRLKTTGVLTSATITQVTGQSDFTILSLTLPDGREVKALPVRAAGRQFETGSTLTVLATPDVPKQVLIPPAS